MQRDYAKGYYRKYPDYYIKKNAQRRTAIYAWLNEQKSKPCTDCAGIFSPCCMDYDHLGNKKGY